MTHGHGAHSADHTPLGFALFRRGAVTPEIDAVHPKVRATRARNTNTFPVKLHRTPCGHDDGRWHKDDDHEWRCEGCGHRMPRIITRDGHTYVIPAQPTRDKRVREWPGEILGRLQARHPRLRTLHVVRQRPDGPAPVPAAGAGAANEATVMPDSAFTAPWPDAEQPSTPPERDTTTFPKLIFDGQVTRRYADPLMHRDPNAIVRSLEGAVRAR